MRLQRILAEREPVWQELDGLLGAHEPDTDVLLRTGALYRATAADLALARRRFPGDPVTARLEALVLRARQVVYADEPRRTSLWRFLSTDYWRRIAERPGLLALAAVLLLAPSVLGAVWATRDPAAAVGVVPSQFADASHPGSGPGVLTPDAQAALSSSIFTNNIKVSFLAVAGGLVFGLGSAAVLLYNGLFTGAIAGLAIHGGQTSRLFELIVPHGVLEESCIIVAGAAGLRIGQALLEPGTLTRGASLRAQARPALELVLGTMPWLVVAGLTEGFVTGSLGGLAGALVYGTALGAIFWALVIARGRQSRPRDFARR